MPQPLSKPTQIGHTPLTIHETRKEHAARIGLIASEWSSLEGHLSGILSFGLFGFSKDEAAAGPVVGVVFAALDSLSTRLMIVDNLLKPRVAPALHQYFVAELVPEIRKRAKERNAVVHGYWGTSPDYPNHIILSPRGGGDFMQSIQIEQSDYMLYSTTDLDDIAKRIKKTIDAISLFQFQIINEQTPLPFLPQPSKPTL
jgi:hypothetical protein